MATRRIDFKTFAAARNANVLDNDSYALAPELGRGVKEGVAKSTLYNKSIRQLSLISTALATYLSNRLDEDVIDDGSIETLIDQIKRAIGVQAAEDVVIPIGTLEQKGIVQFSETLSESTETDKNDLAATIGALSRVHRRVSYLESIINNRYVAVPGQSKYNPIYDWIIPVGTILVYNTDQKDPNVIYPGTKWTKISPGVGLRTARADKADLNVVKGKDSVTLVTDQLPNFNLSVNLSTSEFNYGTKTSNPTDLGTPTTNPHDHGTISTSQFNYGDKVTTVHDTGSVQTSSFDYGQRSTNGGGAHTHTVSISRGGDGGNGADHDVPYAAMWGSTSSNSAGDHSHTISIGPHTHTVPIGTHTHTVSIGAHTHTVTIGAHVHTIALGSHTHQVVIGAHTHTVTGNTGSIGKGYPIDIINTYLGVVAWIRVS